MTDRCSDCRIECRAKEFQCLVLVLDIHCYAEGFSVSHNIDQYRRASGTLIPKTPRSMTKIRALVTVPSDKKKLFGYEIQEL